MNNNKKIESKRYRLVFGAVRQRCVMRRCHLFELAVELNARHFGSALWFTHEDIGGRICSTTNIFEIENSLSKKRKKIFYFECKWLDAGNSNRTRANWAATDTNRQPTMIQNGPILVEIETERRNELKLLEPGFSPEFWVKPFLWSVGGRPINMSRQIDIQPPVNGRSGTKTNNWRSIAISVTEWQPPIFVGHRKSARHCCPPCRWFQ